MEIKEALWSIENNKAVARWSFMQWRTQVAKLRAHPVMRAQTQLRAHPNL